MQKDFDNLTSQIRSISQEEQLHKPRDNKPNESRLRNITIHGANEEDDDKAFLQSFIKDIDTEIQQKSIRRVGNASNNYHPLKVEFESVTERNDVVGKHFKLKNKTKYLKVNKHHRRHLLNTLALKYYSFSW